MADPRSATSEERLTLELKLAKLGAAEEEQKRAERERQHQLELAKLQAAERERQHQAAERERQHEAAERERQHQLELAKLQAAERERQHEAAERKREREHELAKLRQQAETRVSRPAITPEDVLRFHAMNDEANAKIVEGTTSSPYQTRESAERTLFEVHDNEWHRTELHDAAHQYLVVEGGQGLGKTRFGYEAGRILQKKFEGEFFRRTFVGAEVLATLNNFSCSKLAVVLNRFFRGKTMTTTIEDSYRTIREKFPGSTRLTLIIHIDEVQDRPEVVQNFLLEIATSTRYQHDNNLRVIPILTGLSLGEILRGGTETVRDSIQKSRYRAVPAKLKPLTLKESTKLFKDFYNLFLAHIRSGWLKYPRNLPEDCILTDEELETILVACGGVPRVIYIVVETLNSFVFEATSSLHQLRQLFQSVRDAVVKRYQLDFGDGSLREDTRQLLMARSVLQIAKTGAGVEKFNGVTYDDLSRRGILYTAHRADGTEYHFLPLLLLGAVTHGEVLGCGIESLSPFQEPTRSGEEFEVAVARITTMRLNAARLEELHSGGAKEVVISPDRRGMTIPILSVFRGCSQLITYGCDDVNVTVGSNGMARFSPDPWVTIHVTNIPEFKIHGDDVGVAMPVPKTAMADAFIVFHCEHVLLFQMKFTSLATGEAITLSCFKNECLKMVGRQHAASMGIATVEEGNSRYEKLKKPSQKAMVRVEKQLKSKVPIIAFVTNRPFSEAVKLELELRNPKRVMIIEGKESIRDFAGIMYPSLGMMARVRAGTLVDGEVDEALSDSESKGTRAAPIPGLASRSSGVGGGGSGGTLSITAVVATDGGGGGPPVAAGQRKRNAAEIAPSPIPEPLTKSESESKSESKSKRTRR